VVIEKALKAAKRGGVPRKAGVEPRLFGRWVAVAAVGLVAVAFLQPRLRSSEAPPPGLFPPPDESPAAAPRRAAGKPTIAPPLPTETPESHNAGDFGAPADDRKAPGGQPTSTVRQFGDDWYEGAQGFQRAERLWKKTGAPMVVYFQTHWNGWCRVFEMDVLEKEDVKEYLATVIKVRLNPELGYDENDIARRFGVTDYPTFLLLPGDGPPQARRIAPLVKDGKAIAPEDFVARCRAAEK
jgi:hypothetical protein